MGGFFRSHRILIGVSIFISLYVGALFAFATTYVSPGTILDPAGLPGSYTVTPPLTYGGTVTSGHDTEALYIDSSGELASDTQFVRDSGDEKQTYISSNTYAQGIDDKSSFSPNGTFQADNVGSAGNAITLVFNGTTDTYDSVLNTWNIANPSNTATLINGTGTDIPNAQTLTLSGGGTAGYVGGAINLGFTNMQGTGLIANDVTNNGLAFSSVGNMTSVIGSNAFGTISGYVNTGTGALSLLINSTESSQLVMTDQGTYYASVLLTDADVRLSYNGVGFNASDSYVGWYDNGASTVFELPTSLPASTSYVLGVSALNANTATLDWVLPGGGSGGFTIDDADDNMFAGTNSGGGLSTGTGNLFIGIDAGQANDGINNTIIGQDAGFSNSDGDYNTFIGQASGFNNSTGYENTFVGNGAGYNNTTGYYNTFIGAAAGNANTTGNQNTFLGRNTGNNNTTGSDNTFLGYWVGNANTTGYSNTFVGMNTGSFNTTGYQNVFLGTVAGDQNTTGYNNTFVGYASGYQNTTGTDNTFLGHASGYENTTGTDNTFLGYSSGYNNTTGAQNTFLGYSSGYNNTTGTQNTFVGLSSGVNNTTGAGNTFNGFQAGYSNTEGVHNVFIGNIAGYDNTTGGYNIFTGERSGQHNTTGSYNTFSGVQSGRENTTGEYNVFSGYGAGALNYTGSRNAFYGVSAGDTNTTGNYNTLIGMSANVATSSTNAGIAIGYGAVADTYQLVVMANYGFGILDGYFGQGITSGFPYGFTLHSTGGAGTNVFGGALQLAGGKATGNAVGGAINFQTSDAGASGTTLQTLTTKATLLASGNFGIGDTTPDYKLDVETDVASSYVANFFNDGNNDNRYGILIQAGADTPSAARMIQFNDGDGGDVGSISLVAGAAAVAAPSDIRLKENITDFNLGLDSLMNIKVRDFSYISDPNHTIVHGFIAQELYDIYPDAVLKPSNPDEFWKVASSQLTPLIIKSIQDLDLKVKSLESLISGSTSVVDQFVSVILRVKSIVFGSSENPSGFTMYDTVTKEPYCVTLANGDFVKTAGECGTVQNDGGTGTSSGTSGDEAGTTGDGTTSGTGTEGDTSTGDGTTSGTGTGGDTSTGGSGTDTGTTGGDGSTTTTGDVTP